MKDVLKKYKTVMREGWRYCPEQDCYFEEGFQFAACRLHFNEQVTCDECNPLIDAVLKTKLYSAEYKESAQKFVCSHLYD